MPDAATALNGASFDGQIKITEAGPRGMITLRGHLEVFGRQAAKVVGVALPDQRMCSADGGRAVAWMSPDELLIFVPFGDVAATVDRLQTALGDGHGLVANVSDARTLFVLEGAAIRDVLAKLSPADLSPEGLPVGEMRRTRLAQTPAAIWLQSEDRAELICFRSVAAYVFDLLRISAMPGSDVNVLSHD